MAFNVAGVSLVTLKLAQCCWLLFAILRNYVFLFYFSLFFQKRDGFWKLYFKIKFTMANKGLLFSVHIRTK